MHLYAALGSGGLRCDELHSGSWDDRNLLLDAHSIQTVFMVIVQLLLVKAERLEVGATFELLHDSCQDLNLDTVCTNVLALSQEIVQVLLPVLGDSELL